MCVDRICATVMSYARGLAAKPCKRGGTYQDLNVRKVHELRLGFCDTAQADRAPTDGITIGSSAQHAQSRTALSHSVSLDRGVLYPVRAALQLQLTALSACARTQAKKPASLKRLSGAARGRNSLDAQRCSLTAGHGFLEAMRTG